jgi:molecular chaperone Hsp33
MERVVRYLTEEATVRASGVIATRLITDMQGILETGPLATVALGRSLIGCVLMASHLKEGHSVGLYFRGSGPLGTLFAEAHFSGAARAYTGNPKSELPLTPDGRLDVSGGIGHGLLEVVRGTPRGNQNLNHTGTVIIRTGEVGDDIAYYLEQSQQIPSVVALGVAINEYGIVESAGGVLIELMPGAGEDVIAKIEARTRGVQSITKLIQEGATAEALVQTFLADFRLQKLEHEGELRYECRCSLERVERSMILLGLNEIDSMISEGKPIHVTCEFCGRKYALTGEHLVEIRREAHKQSLH